MMNDKKKRFPLFALANVMFVILLGAAVGGGESQAAVGPLLSDTVSDELAEQETALPPTFGVEPINLKLRPTAPAPVPAVVVPPNPWANYPNVCESFTAIQSTKQVRDKRGKKRYPVNFRRNRYSRSSKDRARTHKLVAFVAEEMGVSHPEFFAAFAMHETTWNPEAIHILNPDLQANIKAWERHSYSPAKEAELQARLDKLDARKKEYWKVKAILADIRLYKGNIHWDDRLAYDYVIPEHTVKIDGGEETIPEQIAHQSRSVWGFGYGLYGHYAVGYVRLWDQEAPPWILCGDEGIIATIVQVWAARNNTAECDSLTDKNPEKWGHSGGTYRGVLRRLARGHCSDNRLGKVWQRLFKEYDGIPWDQHADFGLEKWTQWEMKKKRGKWVYKRDADGKKIPSDREAVLAHMIEKARKKGLLRSAPLQLHHEGTEPLVVAGNTPVMGGGSAGNGTLTTP